MKTIKMTNGDVFYVSQDVANVIAARMKLNTSTTYGVKDDKGDIMCIVNLNNISHIY